MIAQKYVVLLCHLDVGFRFLSFPFQTELVRYCLIGTLLR